MSFVSELRSQVAEEPVMIVAAVGSLIGSVATVLAAFDVTALSADQFSAIEALWAIAGPIVAGLVARRYVSPVAELPMEMDDDDDE